MPKTLGSPVCWLAALASSQLLLASEYDDDRSNPDDLRLGAWLMPLSMKVDTRTDGAGGYHKDGTFESGRRYSLQWVPPLAEWSDEGGGLLAFELSSTRYTQKQTLTDPAIDFHAYAFTVHPGFAWGFSRPVHMEIGPFAGYGLSSVSSGDGNGTMWEYGGRLAFYYTAARHLQVGLDARFMGLYARQDFVYGTTAEEVIIRTVGFALGLQAGYRF